MKDYFRHPGPPIPNSHARLTQGLRTKNKQTQQCELKSLETINLLANRSIPEVHCFIDQQKTSCKFEKNWIGEEKKMFRAAKD